MYERYTDPLPLPCPQPGTWPQARALTGNQTHDLLIHRRLAFLDTSISPRLCAKFPGHWQNKHFQWLHELGGGCVAFPDGWERCG